VASESLKSFIGDWRSGADVLSEYMEDHIGDENEATVFQTLKNVINESAEDLVSQLHRFIPES
jgi:hypothetical protein